MITTAWPEHTRICTGAGATRGAAASGNPRRPAIATALHAHYLRVAEEPYRAALWNRRAYLHACGRHGEVYGGSDALRWQRQHERATLDGGWAG